MQSGKQANQGRFASARFALDQHPISGPQVETDAVEHLPSISLQAKILASITVSGEPGSVSTSPTLSRGAAAWKSPATWRQETNAAHKCSAPVTKCLNARDASTTPPTDIARVAGEASDERNAGARLPMP